MHVKYLFCKAIEKMMEAIKEGRSVNQITTEVGTQDLPKMNKSNTDHALIKLSEKVLQMKGLTDNVLIEELDNIDKEKDVAFSSFYSISAFIQATEKAAFSCFEVLSLLEADDLNIEGNWQSKKAVKTIDQTLTPFKITETQEDLASEELVIETQPKNRAISLNQTGEEIQTKVKEVIFINI